MPKHTGQLKKHFITVKRFQVPPLFINKKLVSNFKKKVDHFNRCFVSHCTPLDNNNKIAGNQTYIIKRKLSWIQFNDDDIIKIIKSLDIYKAHGHDAKTM